MNQCKKRSLCHRREQWVGWWVLLRFTVRNRYSRITQINRAPAHLRAGRCFRLRFGARKALARAENAAARQVKVSTRAICTRLAGGISLEATTRGTAIRQGFIAKAKLALRAPTCVGTCVVEGALAALIDVIQTAVVARAPVDVR